MDLFNTLITRVMYRNGGHNYKIFSNYVPQHLRSLEIERHYFVKWIEEYRLLVGLKLPFDIDGVEDPDCHPLPNYCSKKVSIPRTPKASPNEMHPF
ncbi:hypothetical protein Tco_0862873 [Tanacetum coccineum]